MGGLRMRVSSLTKPEQIFSLPLGGAYKPQFAVLASGREEQKLRICQAAVPEWLCSSAVGKANGVGSGMS